MWHAIPYRCCRQRSYLSSLRSAEALILDECSLLKLSRFLAPLFQIFSPSSVSFDLERSSAVSLVVYVLVLIDFVILYVSHQIAASCHIYDSHGRICERYSMHFSVSTNNLPGMSSCFLIRRRSLALFYTQTSFWITAVCK